MVSPTTTTTYTVDGTDVNGCTNSTTIVQDASLCTGIAVAEALEATLSVYPNPNNGLFTVEISSKSQITVLNAIGEVVVSETVEAGKHIIDLQQHATGIYFVNVTENGKQQTIKVIKQ